MLQRAPFAEFAGVQEQPVQVLELFFENAGQFEIGRLGVLAQIKGDGARLPASRGLNGVVHGGELADVARQEDHARAVGRVGQGRGAADAVAGPGDEQGFIAQAPRPWGVVFGNHVFAGRLGLAACTPGGKSSPATAVLLRAMAFAPQRRAVSPASR